MTIRSMAYDHPEYLVRHVNSGLTAVGASGVTTKYAAFTALKLKSITHTPFIASTAAGSQPLVYVKSGTTTTTTTLTVLTSGAVAAINNEVNVTLAQGDIYWYTHGTDATTSVAVAIECQTVAGATISV